MIEQTDDGTYPNYRKSERERKPDIIVKEARGRSMRFKRTPIVESVLK